MQKLKANRSFVVFEVFFFVVIFSIFIAESKNILNFHLQNQIKFEKTKQVSPPRTV